MNVSKLFHICGFILSLKIKSIDLHFVIILTIVFKKERLNFSEVPLRQKKIGLPCMKRKRLMKPPQSQ